MSLLPGHGSLGVYRRCADSNQPPVMHVRLRSSRSAVPQQAGRIACLQCSLIASTSWGPGLIGLQRLLVPPNVNFNCRRPSRDSGSLL